MTPPLITNQIRVLFSLKTQLYKSLFFVVYKVPLETARRKNNRFFSHITKSTFEMCGCQYFLLGIEDLFFTSVQRQTLKQYRHELSSVFNTLHY